MSLPPGTRLGPYEITAAIGAGGMGEVYRARDTKLHRMVAIKSLQASVAADPERIARFEREAQLLASLNHPNIGAIHGLQEAAGAAYLILEFVDGTPLDVMLRDGGPLSAADALPLAQQIAEAIAAAHERGIIHRDLKPGNVMVTPDNQVKVLDFGLGKAIGEHPSSPASQSNSPTMTIGGTQAGIILGTAGYMSPEQAKGRPADKRSDVWSFGCLLFEMLAGSRAFEGEDITDTIAAIVRSEPNWNALPAQTPPPLRTLIERCLVKDRTHRLQDMSVVRYILSESGTAVAPAVAVSTGPAPRARAATPWMIATALSLLAAIGIGIAYLNRSASNAASSTGAALARFTVVLPEGHQVAQANMVPLTMSPAGTSFVYSGRIGNKQQLFVHDFSTSETRPLDGTEGAYSPFFSPDGRWIAFFAKNKLRKITIGGTSLLDLADVQQSRGGSWSMDDTIYYAPTNNSGIWKVAASGGTTTELTKPDPGASEISHRNPYVLPDAKALLMQVWTGPGADEHRIELLTLADGRRQLVVANADGPASFVNGHLVYSGRNDTLLSAPWDPSRPSLQGVEPAVLPFPAAMENEGVSAYSVSTDGTFVHLLGDLKRRLARVVWADGSGKTEPLLIPDRDYVSVVMSPDGSRAAVQSRGGVEDVWMYDFRTKSFTPFVTGSGSSQAPLWTIDSKYVIYRGTRTGTRNLYRKAADGTGDEERLTMKPGVVQTPASATPDGKWILFNESGVGTRGAADMWKVALDGAHETVVVLATPHTDFNGHVSPDGRWMAFETDVSGRPEIWVQPFGGSGAAMSQVSRDGGLSPRWSRDGKDLFFLTPEGVMAIGVTGDAFRALRPYVTGRFRASSNSNTNYDVARDGRLLMVQQIEQNKPQTRVEVVLNGIRKR